VTYAWLCLVFLGVAALVAVAAMLRVVPVARAGRRARLRRGILSVVIAGVALAALTAVFDNVMIDAGLMTYSERHISGAHIGAAPLEDFAYPLAALLLLPSLWVLFAPPLDRSRMRSRMRRRR
jgi:lycopene cyclase domain-containing protein